MNDDTKRLIERTGRTMRPEFRDRLLELLDDKAPLHDRSTARFGDDEFLFVEPDDRREPRRLAVGIWLSVAAAIAVVVVLVVAPRAIDQPGSPAEPGPGTSVAAVAECARDAETQSVVASEAVDIRVGIMPDGLMFCLVDDATGAALIARDPVNLVSADAPPPSQPTIIEQGVAATTAYYYVIAVPEGMPVASIRSSDRQVWSFPTRVGRYFLVLDTSYDVRDSGTLVLRNLNLTSSTGGVLATLVGDPGVPESEGGS